MKHFTIDEIQGWERHYRSNFVNSLSGYKSVSLIASNNKDGVENLAIFSNIVHLGADPALIGFINRPREAAPHTINNIERTKLYTVNHIHGDFVKQAHQTSAKYPETVSEFGSVGIEKIYRDEFPVPFVKESPVQYALELSEIIPLENRTFLVVGSLKHAYVKKLAIGEDGFIDLSKIGSLASLGLDAYYTAVPRARYSYAKPDRDPAELGF